MMRNTTGYRFGEVALRKLQIPLLLAMVFVHGVVGDALAQPSATATAGLWGAAVQAVRGPVANVDRIDLAPLQAPMRVDSVARYAGLDNRGIYGWYADARARSILRQAGLSVRDDGLVYIGKTKDSFRQRVLGKHINGSVQNSTLRKTLRGVLIATDSQATPADVSRFMRAHLKVAMLSIDDAALIDSVERRLIETHKPALNVKGNPNAARVKELRKLEDGIPRRPRVLNAAAKVASARVAIATMAKGEVAPLFRTTG